MIPSDIYVIFFGHCDSHMNSINKKNNTFENQKARVSYLHAWQIIIYNMNGRLDNNNLIVSDHEAEKFWPIFHDKNDCHAI